ncbi:MAG: PhoU domain-containing protein [Ruminococcus callidus]
MELAIEMLFQYDKDIEEQIEENENRIDKYEDKLNAYLVRISKHSISSKDNRTVSKMLHCIGNFERIGDHAVNIMESAHELHEKGCTSLAMPQRNCVPCVMLCWKH